MSSAWIAGLRYTCLIAAYLVSLAQLVLTLVRCALVDEHSPFQLGSGVTPLLVRAAICYLGVSAKDQALQDYSMPRPVCGLRQAQARSRSLATVLAAFAHLTVATQVQQPDAGSPGVAGFRQ